MILIKKIFRKILSIIRSTAIKFDCLYIYAIELKEMNLPQKKYNVLKAFTIDELKDIYEERDTVFKNVYQQWLKAGYICFVVKIDRKTVGMFWLINSSPVPLEFNYMQKLKNKREATLNDAYVLKNFRGKGIYKEVWNAAICEAINLNISTLYCTTLKNNILSLKVHYTLGMRNVIQILYYVRIFWFNFHYLKKLKTPIDITELRKDINFNKKF